MIRVVPGTIHHLWKGLDLFGGLIGIGMHGDENEGEITAPCHEPCDEGGTVEGVILVLIGICLDIL